MSTATKKKTSAKTKAQLLEENEALLARLAKVEGDSEENSKMVNIRPDEYIPVISLCPNPLNLSTSRHGNNKKTFRFPKMGDVKHIMYEYLVEIIENHPTFAESGLFYILNEDVVNRHGLAPFYDKVLTKDEIVEVLSSDSSAAFEIFSGANERQQNQIGDIIERKLVNGEDIDMNLVYKIGKVLERDIVAKAEDTKSLIETQNSGR